MKYLAIALIATVFAVPVVAQEVKSDDEAPAVEVQGSQHLDPLSIAKRSIKLLFVNCLLPLSADELQSELSGEGWVRVGGIPRPPSANVDNGTRDLIEKSNETLDRWRFFSHANYDQVFSFTTSVDAPEVVRDCMVDGPTMEPESLAVLAIESFGDPVPSPDGLVRWPNVLGTKHTLIIAKSMVRNHNFDDAVMLVLRKNDGAHPQLQDN